MYYTKAENITILIWWQ